MRKKSHFESKEPFLENIFRLARYKKISKFIPDNSKVLDLGCGYEGKLLKMVSPRIKLGVGYDISVTRFELPENIKLIAQDVDTKLNEKENAYDVITALAVIEHLRKRKVFLKKIYRVLKPGGKLLITTPLKKSKPLLEFLALKLNLISKEEVMDHKYYYTEKSLLQDLISTGFKKEDIEFENFGLGFNLFAKATK